MHLFTVSGSHYKGTCLLEMQQYNLSIYIPYHDALGSDTVSIYI